MTYSSYTTCDQDPKAKFSSECAGPASTYYQLKGRSLNTSQRLKEAFFVLAMRIQLRLSLTQQGHCERSFGTTMLVLAINATTFSRRPNLPLEKDVNKTVVTEQVPN